MDKFLEPGARLYILGRTSVIFGCFKVLVLNETVAGLPKHGKCGCVLCQPNFCGAASFHKFHCAILRI